MIPSMIALAIGGVLGTTVLWPFEMALQRRTERADARRAEEIAAAVRASARRAAEET